MSSLFFKVILIMSVFTVEVSVAAMKDVRAKKVESLSRNSISKMSVQEKLETTRELALYIEDILPEKGNAYAHFAEFFNDYVEDSYRAAMSSPSQYLELKGTAYWLPWPKGPFINQGDLDSDPATKAAFQYLSRWTGTLEVMKNVNLFYSQSILVESLEDSLGKEISQKFDKAMALIVFMGDKLEAEFDRQILIKGTMVRLDKRRAYLALADQVIERMQPHLDHIITDQNRMAVQTTLSKIQSLKSIGIEENKISELEKQSKALLESPRFKVAQQAFSGVSLPESGSIDGSDDAFEAVTRLEMGFEILENIFAGVRRW